MKDHLLLLTQFLRSPRTVASVAPSSKALITALLKEARVSEAKSMVEIVRE